MILLAKIFSVFLYAKSLTKFGQMIFCWSHVSPKMLTKMLAKSLAGN